MNIHKNARLTPIRRAVMAIGKKPAKRSAEAQISDPPPPSQKLPGVST